MTVRDGKGGKDRVTMVPAALSEPLVDHLKRVKMQHDADVRAGRGTVALPGALRLKYPNAPTEWVGNGSSLRRVSMWTPRRAKGAGTTRTSRCYADLSIAASQSQVITTSHSGTGGSERIEDAPAFRYTAAQTTGRRYGVEPTCS